MPIFLSLYFLIVGVCLLTASGRIGVSDCVAIHNLAQSFAREGALSSEPCNPTSHFAAFQELA